MFIVLYCILLKFLLLHYVSFSFIETDHFYFYFLENEDESEEEEQLDIREVLESARILQDERKARRGLAASTLEEDLKPSIY